MTGSIVGRQTAAVVVEVVGMEFVRMTVEIAVGRVVGMSSAAVAVEEGQMRMTFDSYCMMYYGIMWGVCPFVLVVQLRMDSFLDLWGMYLHWATYSPGTDLSSQWSYDRLVTQSFARKERMAFEVHSLQWRTVIEWWEERMK